MGALSDLLRQAGRRFAIASELLAFLGRRKAYWLIPLVLALLGFSFLFFIASQPAVTPFIYTLF